jgi:hypothetical protein
MSDVIIRTPMQYLDRALTTLRDMGIVPAKGEDAPINALLQKISDLDNERITVIARTLNQASNFNEIVREHVSAMSVGDRYRQITEGFNSIRDDAKAMVDQISDGKVSVWERATNSWMKLTRGDVADRFDKIRGIYIADTKETKNQIELEAAILEGSTMLRIGSALFEGRV